MLSKTIISSSALAPQYNEKSNASVHRLTRTSSRRTFFDNAGATAALIVSGLATGSSLSRPCQADSLTSTTRSTTIADANELPLGLRDYTKLLPLGKSTPDTNTADLSKSYNLPLDQIAAQLTNDLTRGKTGKGGYIISGDLSPNLFKDDCVFIDPTNRVKSLNQYRNALRILFDPSTSTVSLIEPLKVNKEDSTIRGRYRSRGFLQLPWKPYTTAYESDIIYRIDPKDGLIYQQEQKWTKSSTKALQETFTPTIFTPPPSSKISVDANSEPVEVSQLFDYVNGRRPMEYSAEERVEIDTLIQQVANLHQNDWNVDTFPGKWMLVYLQPGPDGAAIDRRIPFFPDFGFNDNYQVFGINNTVVNIGELLGPYLDVRVFGSVQKVAAQQNNRQARLQANINGGKLCANKGRACIDLSIQGEGLFESVYLGKRLRIGQNLNGGGARVVQVRIK